MARRRRRIAKDPEELAAALGVHRTTAHRWQHRGCPRRPDGTFDIDEVAAWHVEYKSASKDRESEHVDSIADRVGNLGTGHTTAADPLKAVKIERERLRAALDELELGRQRGELVERDQMARLLAERMRVFKRALRAVGRRLARRLTNLEDPREVQAIIDAEHDRLLWQAYGQADNDQ